MTINCSKALVTLASVDIEKIVDFYTQLLGQKPTKFIPNVYAEFQLPGIKLAVFKPKNTHELEFSNSGKSKISLCLEVDNLELAIAHLKNIGYPPPGELSIASHGREIYAYDPDGNRIILHQSH
ncbi:MAG: VOC family protein [Cyanomargarita calcarea GSE-NOS-MK-12-04C]|jgi:catechol 2,3-dioxygenase-like lactoylglutathione lyase family enzyme|uniref:VOC family protein n=1 Tax=Cyanomargarita calcarea GSE-NOS-MK-12-04C TaxID=2839659 RepID=A0A951USD0_9CYAN|nr:VOC family protein [Cyanomargarita calcarea GSE-NOS-MK-12-04C]